MKHAMGNPFLVLSFGLSQSQGKVHENMYKNTDENAQCIFVVHNLRSVFSCLGTLPVWRLFNKLLAILSGKDKTYVF